MTDPFTEEEVLQRLAEHCANHRKTGRAQFTTAGIEVLLAKVTEQDAALRQLIETATEVHRISLRKTDAWDALARALEVARAALAGLRPAETKIIPPTGHEEDQSRDTNSG